MVSKGIWIGIIIVVIVVIGFFAFSGGNSSSTTSESRSVGSDSASASGNVDWMNVELKDIRTGETFKISDFKGKPILLESFAVWCPTCTKQQRKIKELHEKIGDDVISISLDTDPEEDEARVREHIESNGFDWYYAISPIEMTQSLINEFGNSIISAPASPMVLICEDLSFRKLGGFGSKNVNKLKDEIAQGC